MRDKMLLYEYISERPTLRVTCWQWHCSVDCCQDELGMQNLARQRRYPVYSVELDVNLDRPTEDENHMKDSVHKYDLHHMDSVPRSERRAWPPMNSAHINRSQEQRATPHIVEMKNTFLVALKLLKNHKAMTSAVKFYKLKLLDCGFSADLGLFSHHW
ncbi:hypothetical protein J3458_002974 [Metarhizium acridum]|uniref:uncharacterized protein n=1 Tax=Metarhizium acridum TaxID=92637 RepID=UPI001C6C3C6B|nr:hypothetical protein J3458_002974 [Metarhizium acridum]